MKPIALVFVLFAFAAPLVAYEEDRQTQKFALILSKDSVNDLKFSTVPCSTTGSNLSIRDAVGELPMTGDNDPNNGAFMRWTATGGSGLYFSQLYQAGGPVYDVTAPGSTFTVFGPNNGADFEEEVLVPTEFNGICLPPGVWTVRVWEVSDVDGDLQPDRDGDGNIIGCFVEATFTFFPSCAQLGTNVPFTVNPLDLGCNGTGGSISLIDFQEEFLYCVDQDGVGATFSWVGPDNFSAQTRDVAGLTPGIYTVDVRDFYGCTFRWSREIVDLDNLAFICSLEDSLSQFGASDGVIVVEATAGTEDYNLSWTGPVSGSRPNISIGPQTISNLPAGTYMFTLTDNISTCVETCTVIIPVPPCLIDFTVSYDEISETITITPLDGTADFFLSYFGPTMAEDLGPFGFEGIVLPESDFLLGNYVFILSEANRPDCALSQTFFIPPECHLEADFVDDPPTCAGGMDGSIEVSVMNNLGEINYDWADDSRDGMSSISNLSAGTYTVQISDSAECFLAPLVIVLDDPPPVEVTLRQLETGCAGEATNVLQADVTGAVGAISYVWSVPAADTNRIGNLSAGIYSVSVMDENGCTGSGAFEITDPAPLTMGCSATDESIVGTADGTITISHAGGLAGIVLSGDLGTFPLRPNADTTFTDLAPGTYSLLLTNPNGCTATCMATVAQGACVLALAIDPLQPDCDSATGSASAQPMNVNGPLTYRWSNDSTGATVTDLAPGFYDLTITDTFACQAMATVEIIAFTDFPTLTLGNASPACPEGGCTDIELTLTGTPPFRVQIEADRSGGATVRTSFTVSGSGSRTFCPSEFGYPNLNGVNIFFRDVTDGNGCRRSINRLATIDVFPTAIGALDTVLCAGDTLTYFGSRFHAGRPSGNVTLPFPTVNGCDTTTAVSVSFTAPAFSALDTTICRGDTLNYRGTLFHANRTTGDVVLGGASVNGCDSTVTVSVGFFPLAAGTLDTMLCSGDSLRLADQVFHAGRPFGDVVLPAASSEGCDSTLSVILGFFPPARGNLDTTICFGDTLRYFGQRFHATNRFGDVILPNASSNGCDSTVSVFIDLFPPARSRFDTTICRNDTLVFHGEVFNVRRMNGDVIVPTPAVTGCDSVVSVSIEFFPQNFDVFDTTICAGDFFFFQNVRFDEAIEDFFIPLGGASINGCDSIVEVNVRVREPSSVVLIGEGIVCPDGSLEVLLTYDGLDPASVRLSDRPGDPITITEDTTVILRDVVVGTQLRILSVTDGSPCPPTFSGSISITESDLAVGISITSGDGIYAVSCADGSDGSVVAIPTGGDDPYRFRWNTGDTLPSLQDLSVGEYEVLVTSRRGCTARASINLDSPETLVVQLTELQAGCLDTLPGLIVQGIRGGVSPYLYRVSGDPGFRAVGPFPDTLRVPFGNSIYELEDVNGCRLSQSFRFNRPGDGQIEVNPRRSVIRNGDSVALTITTDLNPIFYRVWPGPDSIITSNRLFVSPTETTTYVITAVDADGCEATTMVDVIVDRYVPVYVPNVFSPNGDGRNDVFEAYADKTVAAISDFVVFERWGGKVYQINGPIPPGAVNWGWDGKTPSGQLYEQHVYGYTFKVTYPNGEEVRYKGDVLLMR